MTGQPLRIEICRQVVSEEPYAHDVQKLREAVGRFSQRVLFITSIVVVGQRGVCKTYTPPYKVLRIDQVYELVAQTVETILSTAFWPPETLSGTLGAVQRRT